jgi:hypothetical protein
MIWSPLLLADPSACLRWRVLHDLLELPAGDPELAEVAALRPTDPLVAGLLALQRPDGAWDPNALAHSWGRGSRLTATALALARLGYLGFDRSHPAVQRAAGYLFSRQQADGAWPLHRDEVDDEGEGGGPVREGYNMIPLQTAFPLRGLAACGYAADPPCEAAYEWLLAQRLPDGAWPTGMASGVYGYVAGYRRLPHSRWGCRSNTTGALLCLAHHPQRRSGKEARRALDLLLGRETREGYTLGFEIARLVGAEPPGGFITFFARFDLALVLHLCAQIGADKSDRRVSSLVEYVLAQPGPYGLWDHPSHPQVSRWVTLDLLRSLAQIDQNTGWESHEPQTPFQPYPKKNKRF